MRDRKAKTHKVINTKNISAAAVVVVAVIMFDALLVVRILILYVSRYYLA